MFKLIMHINDKYILLQSWKQGRIIHAHHANVEPPEMQHSYVIIAIQCSVQGAVHFQTV